MHLIVPALVRASPTIALMVVVLPAPFGPRNPKNSPELDAQRNAVDGREVAVPLDDVGNLERGRAV